MSLLDLPHHINNVGDSRLSEVDYYFNLSRVTVVWRHNEQNVEIKIGYLPFPKQYASAAYRDSELAYVATCDTTYVLPYFDINVRSDISQFKDVYIQAIRVHVAGRVRIAILTEQLGDTKRRIKAMKELLSQCEEKLQFNLVRK